MFSEYPLRLMSHLAGAQNWEAGASGAQADAVPEAPAGILPRGLALAIDLLLAAALTALIVIPLTWLIEAFHNDLGLPEQRARALAGLLSALVWLLVGWFYEAKGVSGPRWATPGKRLLGLRVASLQGERLNFGQATVRHCTKYLSAFGLMLGFLMAVFDQRRQALHDRVAGTVVLRRN